MKEFLSDVMSLPISDESIYSILQRFTKKALPFYLKIKKRVERLVFLGADETGAKVNGEKHWFWTWQNSELTYIVNSDNRGFKTIENTFANGLPNTVLQHDSWASHFQCNADNHQLCIAHLLRDCNYIYDLYQSDWVKQLKDLLVKAITLKKQMSEQQYRCENIQRIELEQTLAELLKTKLHDNHKRAKTFQKSLYKYNGFILYFLHHP